MLSHCIQGLDFLRAVAIIELLASLSCILYGMQCLREQCLCCVPAIRRGWGYLGTVLLHPCCPPQLLLLWQLTPRSRIWLCPYPSCLSCVFVREGCGITECCDWEACALQFEAESFDLPHCIGGLQYSRDKLGLLVVIRLSG